MKFNYSYQGRILGLAWFPSTSEHRASFGGRDHVVRILGSKAGELAFEIDGHKVKALVAKEARKVWVHVDGKTYELERMVGAAKQAGLASGERVLRAPMPGQVRQVAVKAGQEVKVGEVLVLLEAMKMEIRIQAPQDAKVARVAVSQGQSVEREQILVELEGEGE
jgi:acetyl/propionyl-CoA carboxylase alpha subunit